MKNRPPKQEVRAQADSDVRFALLLSIYYHLGEGGAADQAASQQWYERAILTDDAEYLCQLGELREQGHLLGRDFVVANKAYLRAMALDEAKGAYMLARLALNPTVGNPFRNLHTALVYLMRAERLGHIPSKFLLAQTKMHAGWRYRLPALIEAPSALIAFLRAVVRRDAKGLWRYADVFRKTAAIEKYVGKDRAFSAPRTLEELDLQLLAPARAPQSNPSHQ